MMLSRPLLFVALASSLAYAAQATVDGLPAEIKSASANSARSKPASFSVLHAADVHKFTFARLAGKPKTDWAYAAIASVGDDGVTLHELETSQGIIFITAPSALKLPLNSFIPDNQEFIKNWALAHPADKNSEAPSFAENDPASIVCVTKGYPYRVDTSGVLKGKTITAIASGADHFLALCSDGTLAAWGQNTYGQLGNGPHGADAFSAEPVLVDTADALKGKTIASIGASLGASYALCSDGTLYTWGLLPMALNLGVFPSQSLPDGKGIQPQNIPTLFDPTTLKGKSITAVSFTPGGIAGGLLALCSDGTLFRWDMEQDTHNLIAMRMDNQSDLKGKKVILVDGGEALCADGTLAQWQGYMSSTEKKLHYGSVSVQQGPLLGKTIMRFSLDFALCSDGTLAYLAGNKFKPHWVAATLPKGKKIADIARGLCLYTDKTLGPAPLLRDQREPTDGDQSQFIAAFQGKTILAIATHMVLFKNTAPP